MKQGAMAAKQNYDFSQLKKQENYGFRMSGMGELNEN